MSEPVDKRAFLAARRCLTQGWYIHHAPGEVPAPGLQWRFYAGADVARQARAWLGEGRSLQRAPFDSALQATDDAVKNPESNLLFEASFQWGGLVTRADVLRRSDDGWTLVEIKSGKASEDGKEKGEYLDDLAYTTCVASGDGLPIVHASLVLLSRVYTLGGEADVFVEIDVTAEVLRRATAFSQEAQAIATAVSGDQRPDPSLKFACKDCEFFETVCIGKDVPDPLFVLPRLSEKKFAELSAYERITHLPSTAKLTEPQQRVAEIIRSGQPRTERAGLQILDDVAWPAYYLDFEAVMPHLPWFEGRPPYDAVPFQYSLHIRSAPGATLEHHEYLATVDGDWRRAFTEQLLADLGSTGSIVVYSSYEKTRLTALATLFPDLREAIGLVVSRLFDLEQVFKNGYWHPGFGGRTTIKKVLPVMVPDLRYDTLAVNNGDDAAGVFGLMRVGEYPADTHERHRRALLKYCSLDTMALVRLHEVASSIKTGAG